MTIELETRIRDLKLFLSQTDFKIIKCYEAQLLNIEMPYDFIELIKQREEWRKELNNIQPEQLEEQLEEGE
jgi:hypothetical protein